MDSLGYIRIGYVRVDLVRLVGLMVSHWRRFYKWELFCSFSKLPNKCSTFCCRFPDKSKQRDLYLEWVRLCRRTVDPSNTALVCSAHFRPSMVNTTMHHAQLREGAIPELVDLPSHLQVGLLQNTVMSISV